MMLLKSRDSFLAMHQILSKVQFVKMHLHTLPEYPFTYWQSSNQVRMMKTATGVASVIRQSLGMASDYTLVMHDMFTRKLLNKLDEIQQRHILKSASMPRRQKVHIDDGANGAGISDGTKGQRCCAFQFLQTMQIHQASAVIAKPRAPVPYRCQLVQLHASATGKHD